MNRLYVFWELRQAYKFATCVLVVWIALFAHPVRRFRDTLHWDKSGQLTRQNMWRWSVYSIPRPRFYFSSSFSGRRHQAERSCEPHRGRIYCVRKVPDVSRSVPRVQARSYLSLRDMPPSAMGRKREFKRFLNLALTSACIIRSDRWFQVAAVRRDQRYSCGRLSVRFIPQFIRSTTGDSGSSALRERVKIRIPSSHDHKEHDRVTTDPAILGGNKFKLL